MRPGYLAKWVEFSIVQVKRDGLIPTLLERHHKIMSETTKNVEADHDRFHGGLNRDLNFEAVQLRIRIEEATKGRKLTEEEK